MKVKVLSLTLILVMLGLIIFTGCQVVVPTPAAQQGGATTQEQAPQTEGTRYQFCIVHNNADHPSITAIVQGMQDEAAAYGFMDLTFYDPAFDPQKQLDMIDDCIALQADVIAVNAVDPAAVVAGLKKANDAGIPVVMHNADTNEEGQQYSRTYVGAPAIEQGRAVGQAMVETLPEGAKGVLIIGKPGQTDVVLRTQGVKEAIAAAGRDDIQFLDEQPADWLPDKALTVMQDFLTRYPPGEIDFLLALDDPMALGAMEAIKAAGRLDEIKIYGFNGNKEACQAIKNGEMEATALSLSYLTGVYTIRAMYDVTQNRLLPRKIDSPTTAVTADNIDQWMAQCW